MNLKYFLGALVTIPLLPLLYIQGKQLKRTIPDLPEAKGDSGTCGLRSNRSFNLLVMGESTMAGVGVETHEEGFAGMLANGIAENLERNVIWKVHAKSGITASRSIKEILPQVETKQWDLIVIGLGGNDAFKLNSPIRWKKDIENLINSCQQKFGKVPIVFTNMPPIKEFPAFTPLMKFSIGNLVEILGESLDQVIQNKESVYYASDVITIKKWSRQHNLSDDITQYFSDGVHPSKLTYQLLARHLVNFISNKVEI